MFAYLIISIMLSVILIFSSFFTRKVLHPYETGMNWLFTSSLLFICSNIIDLNQKWIEVSHAQLPFWILTLNRLFIIPGLTLWLLFLYSSKNFRPIFKVLSTSFWFVLMVELQFYHDSIGLIHFRQWTIYFSILEWFIIWLLSFAYWTFFRLLLRKEAV
ncbi:hypothetical protein EV282_0212 [Fictibacillus sp. BK138]|jgi:hypothetical protein|nr:hypothetical protein EV282_0212 [Fictibacillus sp. BK138]